jgi:K+-sensing histidine kinase KdpD
VFYARTNKNVTFRRQIAKHQHRQQIIKEIKRKVKKAAKTNSAVVPFEDSDPLPSSKPHQHDEMSATNRFPINLYRWLDENENDSAFQVSIQYITL